MDLPEERPVPLDEFDAAPSSDAAAELVACCASRRWVGQLVKGRPYLSLDRLTAASDSALAALSWQDITQALAVEPRIDQPRIGGRIGDNTARRLAEANLAYEQRFGHVFLVSTAGLSFESMLASLQRRLHNDPVAEQTAVRTELAKIVRLRLAKAFRD